MRRTTGLSSLVVDAEFAVAVVADHIGAVGREGLEELQVRLLFVGPWVDVEEVDVFEFPVDVFVGMAAVFCIVRAEQFTAPLSPQEVKTLGKEARFKECRFDLVCGCKLLGACHESGFDFDAVGFEAEKSGAASGGAYAAAPFAKAISQ